MNREELFEVLGGIAPVHIQAAEGKKKRRARAGWISAAAAVLVVAVLCGVLLRPGNSPLVTSAFAIAEAEYPEKAPYPDRMAYAENDDWDAYDKAFSEWWAGATAQSGPIGYANGLESFFAAAIPAFLSGAGEENAVCSPVSAYMALAMLAEVSDGESRAQILRLLGHETVEGLREQAGYLWNDNYRNGNDTLTCILANSLWLNEDISYVQQTMDTLAADYYASSYQGKMGSAEYNEAFQSWLNEQTGGLLAEQAGQMELSADTVLALASTVYFKGSWNDKFDAADTEAGIFHGSSGDVTVDFMHKTLLSVYHWGNRFSAIKMNMNSAMGSSGMWLILPDEGIGVEELLWDEQVMDLILNRTLWEQWRDAEIDLAMPKFDVASQMDLKEGLQALGVTDVFAPDAADFSPMTTDVDGIFVSRVEHDARVVVDEEGCTAAAYTATELLGGGAFSADEVEFVLDRPFLFVLTGPANQPLFAGVVNQP